MSGHLTELPASWSIPRLQDLKRKPEPHSPINRTYESALLIRPRYPSSSSSSSFPIDGSYLDLLAPLNRRSLKLKGKREPELEETRREGELKF